MKLKSLINILKLALWLPFLGMLGCEMVVDIELPPHESKLVVNCLLTPDSLVTVRVYKSLGPLDRMESVAIQDAKVILLENGLRVDSLPLVNNPYDIYYKSKHFKPQENKTYTLLVKAPGYPDAQATCTIPGKVPIQKASIRDSAGLDEDGGYYSRLLITFQDPGEVKNYYNVSGEHIYAYPQWDPNAPVQYYKSSIYFFSDLNDVADGGSNGMLLKDDLFNGRQYDLALNFYPPISCCQKTVWFSSEKVRGSLIGLYARNTKPTVRFILNSEEAPEQDSKEKASQFNAWTSMVY